MSSGDTSSGVRESSDDSTSTSSSVINDQFRRAIESGDLATLREIISLQDAVGDSVVTDDHIHEALSDAALAGILAACRLLWGKLSQSGKQRYFAATIILHDAPLHQAAIAGNLDVVRLFIKEFKWNINQIIHEDRTPLSYAVQHLDTCRFLLENGANVNEGVPLWSAVIRNNTEVCRLLLVEYQANPNLIPRTRISERQFRNSDYAILKGNAEILRMLLEYGAFVGHAIANPDRTSLNLLLCKERLSRETKLAICHILLDHAKENQATAAFLRASFKFAMKRAGKNQSCCQLLLDAGMDKRMALYCAIQGENLAVCQLLVNGYQVDPFLQAEEEIWQEETAAAASPFLAAARLADTSIFECLLDLWDSRLSSNDGGKNSDGDYPLHVVCCDPRVSLEVIKVLVDRQADVLAIVDGEQGLLPFHFAANWDARLDVIFYLLKHCPDALRHAGNDVGTATIDVATATTGLGRGPSSLQDSGSSDSTVGMIETNGDADKERSIRGPAKKKAKARHSG